MNPLYRTVSKIVVSLIAVGFTLTASAAPTWWRAETQDFIIVGNARKHEIQQNFEAIWEAKTALQSLFPKLNRTSNEKLLIIIPGDAKTRETLSFRKGRRAKNLGGYFTIDAEGAFAVVNDTGGSEMTRHTLIHEYVHHLMSDDSIAALWLKEGMAELFSSTQKDKSGKLVIGQPLPNSIGYLKYKGLMDFDRLFQATRSSPEYTSGEHAGTFYCQSWLFLHYLIFGENDIEFSQVTRFVDFATHHLNFTEKDITDHLGLTYAELQETLKKHLNTGTYRRLEIELDEAKAVPQLELEKVGQAYVRRLIARVTLQVMPEEESRPWIEAAIASDPNSPEAISLQAEWLLDRENYEEASNLFEKSLAMDSEQPRALMGSVAATIEIKLSDKLYSPGALNRDDTLLCLQRLFKARELGAGRNPDLYRLIGLVWLSSEVYPQDKHMSVIYEGHEAFPANIGILQDLSLYLARKGDLQSARDLAKKVMPALTQESKVALSEALAKLARWRKSTKSASLS
ncbi:hypothetical protein [Pelagicoccus albus]|uniref:DUF1570 domain-containing protein n=1 Tax=Pelagicoccus albus TaxID=415222 RepID=A0A7X1E8G7_9BACT|nr:hypothetical protein [Pelagicoccus albus]MBC2606246.1 hypothetical protein [Pelagicoccus albus]